MDNLVLIGLSIVGVAFVGFLLMVFYDLYRFGEIPNTKDRLRALAALLFCPWLYWYPPGRAISYRRRLGRSRHTKKRKEKRRNSTDAPTE